jgi:3'-5' exoribonuclease
MTRSRQGTLEQGDILTVGVGNQQLDVERTHSASYSDAQAPGEPARRRRRLLSRRTIRIPGMTAPLDIAALRPGDEIQHTMLLVDVVARGGEHPRTTLVFGHRTGKIESAPFWAGRDEMIRGLARGMVVQVLGKVTTYRDATQLETISVRALPKGSVSLADLVPSVGSTEKYWQFVDDLRARITAPRLTATLDLFYADSAFRDRYDQCPGAPGTGHHALLGGLLQHTCEVLAIGRQIARVAHADEELVVAGALLHDIGKTLSYSWEGGVFETTERGRLVGHVVDGVLMLRDAVHRTAAPTCTPDELLLLEHFILSHHGALEYGAPVRPATLEAEILHFADDASAKTASIADAYQSTELFPAGARVSTKRVWQLDNRWMVRIAADFGRAETPSA